jgi:phosphoglycolate phosphatase-like HAD superfamily hydrolase
MSKAAVMWIRDGVLVNRMHVNPVAFAFAYLLFMPGMRDKQEEISLEHLINFGFEKSGLSASEKMRLFAMEHGGASADLTLAASFYTRLATEAAAHCRYFDGAVQLMAALHETDVQNFITSAVEQNDLDAWAEAPQGVEIKPWLTEILGQRKDFAKGRDHFRYVANQCEHGRIYYVADAVSEIAAARKYAEDFNITPIGFAYVVRREQVLSAVELVQQALVAFQDSLLQSAQIGDELSSSFQLLAETRVRPEALSLFDATAVELALNSAGANRVATGNEDKIMANLAEVFQELSLLPTS